MALGPSPPPLRPGHGRRAPLGPAPHRPARQEPHGALHFPAGTGGTPRSPKGDKTFCGPGHACLSWRYGGLLGEGLCGVNFKDKRISAEDTQEVRAGKLGSVFPWRCTEFVLRPVCRGESAAGAWLPREYDPIGTGYAHTGIPCMELRCRQRQMRNTKSAAGPGKSSQAEHFCCVKCPH